MTLTTLWLVSIVLLVIGLLTSDHDYRAATTGLPQDMGDVLWMSGAYLFIVAYILTIVENPLNPGLVLDALDIATSAISSLFD